MKLSLPKPAVVKAHKSIGLDIGFHSIKVVELTPKAEGFEISKFAVEEIPASILQTKDRAGPLGKLIRRMMDRAKFSDNRVYLSITGHNVVIRQATLPKMPEDELREAIKWNAKEDVLFNMDGAAVDYFLMGEKKEDGADFLELLTVIVRQDVIPFMISIVQNAGLQPMGVTIVPLALRSYYQSLHPFDPEKVISWVDMGAERTRVYFASEGRLLFSREIPNGGKNISAALVGEYELEDGKTAIIDAIRAEEIKKTFGLPAEDAEGNTEDGIPLQLVRERVLSVVAKQVEEFQRSIDYFKNQYRKDRVDRLILSGGGVGLRGVYQYLTENLDMEIERCNPLFQGDVVAGDVSKDRMKLLGPSLTVAAGLALGKCAEINVLPEEYRITFKKTVIKWIPAAVGVLLISGLVAFSNNMRDKISELEQTLIEKQKQSSEIQAKISKLKLPQKELEELKKERSALLSEKQTLPGATGFPVDFPLVLDELARLVAMNSSLSEITYSASGRPSDEDDDEDSSGVLKIRIKGNIFGEDIKAQNTLKYFLEDLKRSPVFKEVKLINSKAMPEGEFTHSGLDFELDIFPEAPDSA